MKASKEEEISLPKLSPRALSGLHRLSPHWRQHSFFFFLSFETGWARTQYVDEAGLEIRDPPASTSGVPRL